MGIEQRRSLAGRRALVTGAGVGIGRAVALALARAGAAIGLHYHASRQGAREALHEIESIPPATPEAAAPADKRSARGWLFQGDLTREADAHRVVDEFVAQAGGLDILVNNAGALLERARIEDTPLDLWRRTLDANLTSAFLVTRRAIPHLRATGKGSIVNVLSLSVQTGGANGAGAYAAAKGGLQVFTRTLARELAPGVRTNAVMPGVIETRHHALATTPERMEEYRRQTPLGRNGQAQEVADAVLYLAGEGSSFVNGALLDISGGRFLR